MPNFIYSTHARVCMCVCVCFVLPLGFHGSKGQRTDLCKVTALSGSWYAPMITGARTHANPKAPTQPCTCLPRIALEALAPKRVRSEEF